MKASWFFIVFCLLLSSAHLAQDTDEQLANYYYSNGDCEKAMKYFEIVFDRSPSHFIFTRYLDCTKKLESEKEVVKLIKLQIKNFPAEVEYKVLLAKTYEEYGDDKQAEKTFENLIDNIEPNSRSIINTQKALSKQGKHELALQALEKGRKILKGNYPLNIQFAEVYGELGRTEEMIDEYLGLLDYNPGMISSLQRMIPRMVDFDDENSEAYQLLKTNLIKRIQKNPNETSYSEMLIWVFVQRKDFAAALLQAKALDKRTTKDGREPFSIGRMAKSNKDYATARKAFKYIVEQGESTPYYYVAEQALLNTRFLELTVHRNYDQEELKTTIGEYEQALARIGKIGKALPVVKEFAQVLAYYAQQPDRAKRLLEEALEYPNASDLAKAEIKTLLADILVLLDDIWEASLLYMQVEKAFKYEPIGFEAKYKNARIFYYDGDFVWAQSQLDILKESTSKLIANDAMKLSIFITDNLGLDSNVRAMRKFAQAELFIKQHQYNMAFHLLDSIQQVFPYHGLADDILLIKAKAMQDQGKWSEAVIYLETILEKHGDDIHADDALFQLGSIHENYLFDNDKAKEYYFRILKEYKGSLYVTEARKRYRELQNEL